MMTSSPHPLSLRRALVLVAATVALVVAHATGLPAPADAAPSDDYVALGDSFSAGTGTRAPTDACYRSPYGYPVLLADGNGLDLDYQACSGATTADVLANQLDTLSSTTGYVTMTIGGNDLGFADVITECALPWWASNCYGAIDDARDVLRTALPGRLDRVYQQIDTRAPAAEVAIAGYPRLFMGEDCNLFTFFSRGEMAELNRGTDDLDALIRQRATARGFTYVEVRDDFLGHAWCADQEWINGLSLPIEESYHPNRAGNVGYAGAVGPSLGLTGAASSAIAARSAPSSSGDEPSLREQADRVLDMDLASPANLRRAQAAGVDRGRIVRATAMLRSNNLDVVRTGLEDLQRLDAQGD